MGKLQMGWSLPLTWILLIAILVAVYFFGWFVLLVVLGAIVLITLAVQLTTRSKNMLEPHIEIVTQIDRLFEAIFEGRVEDAEQFLNSPEKLTGEELLSANSAKLFSRPEEDIGTKPVIREAIIFGLTEYLRRILKAGFDANTSWGSETALMNAASYGRADIARLLLFHGANPYYETDRLSTIQDSSKPTSC